jgi:hypothetical protein
MRKLMTLVLAAGLLSTSAFAVDNGQQRAQKANHRAQKKYLKAQRKAMKKAHYGPRHTVKNRASR